MHFILILVSSLSWLVGGAQNDYNAPFQTSTSVPVGTVLPGSMKDADGLLKLAIKRNNAFTAPMSSEWGGLVEPSLRFQVFLQNAPTNDSFLLAQEFCNHVTHRAHAIIGTLDSTTVATMASYSKAFQIPWLSPSHTTPDLDSDYLISLHPRLESFFLCLIRTIGLTKVTYIYDGHEVHLPVKALLSFAAKHKMEVRVLDVGGSPNVLPVLKDIACRAEYQLIYDVTKERSLQIMRQIYAIGMMSYEYLHVFTSVGLIEEDISRFASGSAKLYFISIVDWESPAVESARQELKTKRRGEEVEITDEGLLVYDAFTAMAVGMKSIGRKRDVFNVDTANVMGSDTVNCHQMPIVPLPTGLLISQAIKSVSFTGLTGTVEFDSSGRRVNYAVSLYSGERSGVAHIGTWTDRFGEFGQLTINGTIPTVNVLETISNQTLIVTTILEEPYVTLKSNWKELQGNDRFEGYCVDLLKEITTLAPFQYQIKPVEDGQYGSRNDKDGTWNGMIGEVKYQKAHLAVAPLTITSAREAVVDFTKPFMSLGISIMIKKPQKQTPNIFSFLEPLSNEIWICIAFAYTGVSVVLYLVSRLSPYEWHKGALTSNITQEEEADSVTDFGIMNSFWFSLGAFVQQGCDISPKSFSGRIVGGVWWFFTLIIISSYTANLAAFLTVDRMVSPISGAEDLAKQNIIKYGTLRSGSTSNFFKQSPLPTYEKMWGFMNSQDPTVFVSSSKAGIERVRKSNGKYAFLMESTLNDYIEQRSPCDTIKVGPNIDAKGYGIALAKGSPLYDTVNLAILTLREQGKLQKMKNRWWYDKSECGAHGSAPPAKTPALMLSNVAGVFYILIVGMILAVLFSIVEYCYVAITAEIAKKAGADAKRRDSAKLTETLSGHQVIDLLK